MTMTVVETTLVALALSLMLTMVETTLLAL